MMRHAGLVVLTLTCLSFAALAVPTDVGAQCCMCCRAGGGMGPGGAAAAAEQDPVCNMSVDPAKAKEAGRVSEYKGKTVYFCSDHCKKQFDADPAKYETGKKDKN